MATPPVTLESLDAKVDGLVTEVDSLKKSIGPALAEALDESFAKMGAAADAANQRRHDEAIALTREVDSAASDRHAEAMATHDAAMNLARTNHGALIRKLTDTVDAFASRSEVEELRTEVKNLRAIVERLQAKVEPPPPPPTGAQP